jgi:hypothetical protein
MSATEDSSEQLSAGIVHVQKTTRALEIVSPRRRQRNHGAVLSAGCRVTLMAPRFESAASAPTPRRPR